jgi:tRNA-dihydrouridine synthase B
MIDHIQRLYEFYGEHRGVRIARKHIAWYAKEQPDAETFRAGINRIETASEQLAAVSRYFESLVSAQAHAMACAA